MKRWLPAVALAVVLIAMFAWRVQRETPTARARVAPVVVASPHAMPPAMPIVVTPGPARGNDGVSTDDPVTAYEKQSVYPPASRPLTAEHADLLAPNARHELQQPTEARDGTEMLFTADRYFVVGDETITPTLSLVKNGKPVPYRVTQAFVAVLDPRATADAPRYPFTVGAPFAPRIVPVERQAAMGLFVELVFGGVTQRAQIAFQYTPAAGIPARFTGQFRDAIEDGSLVVRAEVEVARAGRYLIDCNLFDASDRPIAWTRAKVELRAGTQDVPLMFFGKVLVDQEASGALHIGQLRGARHAPDRDPDLEQMAPFGGTYTTGAHVSGAFSATAYDSVQKREMLEFLRNQRDREAHQGAAR